MTNEQRLIANIREHGPVPVVRVYSGTDYRWVVAFRHIELEQGRLIASRDSANPGIFAQLATKKKAQKAARVLAGRHGRFFLPGPHHDLQPDQLGVLAKNVHCVHGRWIVAPSHGKALQRFVELYVVPRLNDEQSESEKRTRGQRLYGTQPSFTIIGTT